MTHFADLTPYTYWDPADEDEPWPGVPLLNVGWLDAEHPFTTGEPPDGLLAAVERLARHRVRLTRGFHACEICARELGADAREAFSIGLLTRDNGEFRVAGDGVVHACPVMLPHYMTAHAYLPPDEFRTAALAAT